MALDSIVVASWWLILPLGVVGSALHFLFDWTGHNRFVAIFSAVNESYWEHIKIAVWPVAFVQLALFSLGGYQYPSFIPAATIALYSIPITMVGLVFLYKAIARKNILWLDIGVFFACIALSQTVFVLFLEQLSANSVTVLLATLFLAGLIGAFLLFTMRPPNEPDVFVDPINKKYGLDAHPDLPPLAPDSPRT